MTTVTNATTRARDRFNELHNYHFRFRRDCEHRLNQLKQEEDEAHRIMRKTFKNEFPVHIGVRILNRNTGETDYGFVIRHVEYDNLMIECLILTDDPENTRVYSVVDPNYIITSFTGEE